MRCWLRITIILLSGVFVSVMLVTLTGARLPHGAHLSFLRHLDSPTRYTYDLMLHDPLRGVEVPVLELAAAPPQMAWSPGGATLAYFQTGLSRSLTLFTLETGTVRDIQLGVYLPVMSVPLAWSADDQRVAFAVRQVAADGLISVSTMLVVVDITTGRVIAPLDERYQTVTAAQWSPTQPDVLAFAADGRVYALDLNNLSPQPISRGTSFTWSTDGTRITAHNPNGTISVTEMGGASGQVQTNVRGGTVVWSPDGDELVYGPGSTGGFDLFRYDLDSGVISTLAGTRTYEGQPAYSPDGRWIAYVATLDGHDNIILYDTRREARFRLRRLDSRNWSPAWRPAG